jgi:hypothetical protein
MGKTSKSKKNSHSKKTKTREELLQIKKLSDIQLAMIDDPTILTEHVSQYAKLVNDYPLLDIQDPIYIRSELERMTLWHECASKTLQATVLMNEDSITDLVTDKLNNNEYINYVKLVIDHYNSINS